MFIGDAASSSTPPYQEPHPSATHAAKPQYGATLHQRPRPVERKKRGRSGFGRTQGPVLRGWRRRRRHRAERRRSAVKFRCGWEMRYHEDSGRWAMSDSTSPIGGSVPRVKEPFDARHSMADAYVQTGAVSRPPHRSSAGPRRSGGQRMWLRALNLGSWRALPNSFRCGYAHRHGSPL